MRRKNTPDKPVLSNYWDWSGRKGFDYLGSYREHMRKEEEFLFPLAHELLTAEDWAAIDRAFEGNQDPLAGMRDTRDFEKLFQRIAEIAPPPIGLGCAELSSLR